MKKVFAIEYSCEPNVQESYIDRDMYSSIESVEKSLKKEGYVKKNDSHDNTFYEKENKGQYAIIRDFNLHD